MWYTIHEILTKTSIILSLLLFRKNTVEGKCKAWTPRLNLTADEELEEEKGLGKRLPFWDGTRQIRRKADEAPQSNPLFISWKVIDPDSCLSSKLTSGQQSCENCPVEASSIPTIEYTAWQTE
jgi:hypothetical protein